MFTLSSISGLQDLRGLDDKTCFETSEMKSTDFIDWPKAVNGEF